MKFQCVLNAHGGTLATDDPEARRAQIQRAAAEGGHEVEVKFVKRHNLVESIRRAAESDRNDAVMIAGGDGSVSCAAGFMAGTGKPLAIVPAGTMNLFARSLKIPLDLDEAIEALFRGEPKNVDLGRANDHIFIHQISLGMHARMVQLRSNSDFGSRLRKIWAGTRALLSVLFDPPRVSLYVDIDETGAESIETVAFSVSNNVFSPGHIPYADRLDEGVLGIYVAKTRRTAELTQLVIDVAAGSWRDNPHLKHWTATSVTVRSKRKRRLRAVVDGEIVRFPSEISIEIMPGALTVMVPRAEDRAE